MRIGLPKAWIGKKRPKGPRKEMTMNLSIDSNISRALAWFFSAVALCFCAWQWTTCGNTEDVATQTCITTCIEHDREPGECRAACTDSVPDRGHASGVNYCIRECIDETKEPIACKQACTRDPIPKVTP